MAEKNSPFVASVTEPIRIPPKPKFELLVQVLTLIFSAGAFFTALEINNRLKKVEDELSLKGRLNNDINPGRISSPIEEEFTG